MSYRAVAAMAGDQQLGDRVTACVALEGDPAPELWWHLSRWKVVARSDWSDAWSYAEATGKTGIGGDESVITDQMILSSVQQIRGAI